jgi:hypothetical protein
MDLNDFEIKELLHIEPINSWGVSYDLFTRHIEDDLQDGWHIRRGQLNTRCFMMTCMGRIG